VNRLTLISLSLILGGCAAPQNQIKTVKVPAPIPCVHSAEIPDQPGPLGDPKPKTVDEALRRMALKIIEWKGYGVSVDALLRGCSIKTDSAG